MQTIIYDPATHVLVPRYPTSKMVHAFFGLHGSRPDDYIFRGDYGNVAFSYCEMLAAAPPAPQSSYSNNSNSSIPPNSRELEALRWTAAALSAVVKIKHFSEKDRFLMDDGKGKTIGEILDMATTITGA